MSLEAPAPTCSKTHIHTHTQNISPPLTLSTPSHRASPAKLQVDFKPTCTINDAILAFVGAPGGGHTLLLLQPDEHHSREGQGSDQGFFLRCYLTEGLYDLESLNEVEQVNILTRVSIVKPYASVVLKR